MNNLLIFIVFISMMSPAVLYGQSVDELIEMALSVNPQIQAVEATYQATQETSRAVSELPDPMFMIEFRGTPLNPADVGDTREVMFMLQQMFPYPGKLKTLRRQSETKANVQHALIDARRVEVRAAVQQAYYQLYQVDRALEINAEQQQLAAQFVEVATAKYVTDQASQADVLQAQTRQSALKTARLVLEQQRQSALATLNQLLHRPVETPLEHTTVPSESPRVPNYLTPKLIATQPLLVAAQLQIKKSDVDIHLAELQAKPDFTLMGGYTRMNGMDDAWMGRFSMTLPFLPWANGDVPARIRSAHQKKAQRDAELQVIQDRLAAEFNATLAELNALQEQIEIYRTEILPQAEQTVSAALAAYQTDLVDFLTLISAEQALREHQLQYVTRLSKFYQTWASLEKIVGRPLSHTP
ncbi:MAG: TolC family protein [Gemmatimonadetes bacterium]|nr:MAG: TolC family protein [Gemmatimonadota bacterium]